MGDPLECSWGCLVLALAGRPFWPETVNHPDQNVCICRGEHCVLWTSAGARGEGEVCRTDRPGKAWEGFLLSQQPRLFHLSFTSARLTPRVAGGSGTSHTMLGLAPTWRLLSCRPWTLSCNPHALLPQRVLSVTIASSDLSWAAPGPHPLLCAHWSCHDSGLDPLSPHLLSQHPATPSSTLFSLPLSEPSF